MCHLKSYRDEKHSLKIINMLESKHEMELLVPRICVRLSKPFLRHYVFPDAHITQGQPHPQRRSSKIALSQMAQSNLCF